MARGFFHEWQGNYLAYFMLTLLPSYLVSERRLSMQSMAKVASAYYAIEGLSAVTTGWFSDFFSAGAIRQL
jgi:hypothetical protein